MLHDTASFIRYTEVFVYLFGLTIHTESFCDLFTECPLLGLKKSYLNLKI